jgi:uncharacterized RDD family membrane protein YckC
MGTYSQHQAYPRRSVRIPAYVITLALMVISAIAVVVVIVLGLSVLFSMGTYLETVIP